MYCTKCGKELYPDDRFCAYCGAEVRNREKPKPKYEDIVFNPPFKIEAEKKTREILQAASQPQPEETPKQTEPVSFDWKLEEPTRKQPAKTEEVDFNWESVLERRNLSRTQEINIERIRAAQLEAESGLSFAPREDANPPAEEELERYEEARIKPEEPREISEPAHTQPEAAQAEAASIEALERELFGTKKPVQEEGASSQPEQPKEPKHDERFHTYHQKTDAFDELLKQEKERVDAMQEEYGRSPRNLDYTWVSEVFPPKRDEPIAAGQVEAENTHPKQEAQSPQPQPETEPARTPIAEVPAQPDVSVEVVQPTTPKRLI